MTFHILIFILLATLSSSTWAQDEKMYKNSDESSDESTETESNINVTFYQTTNPRRSPTTQMESETPEEDKYIKHFGNDIYRLKGKWKTIYNWYLDDEERLRKLCAVAHVKAGYSEKVQVDVAFLNLRDLIFLNEKYQTRKVDVITYSTVDGVPIQEKRQYWYLTEGVRPDCVFYVLPAGFRDREFKLQKQICGIKVF